MDYKVLITLIVILAIGIGIGILCCYLFFRVKGKKMVKAMEETDVLTGLYSRRAAQEIISERIAKQGVDEMCALLVMDLDRFKEVNDTYGHEEGDGLLVSFANVLKECANEGDVIGRVGGDEFLFYLKDVEAQVLLDKRLHYICELVHNEMLSKKQWSRVSVSVGVAIAKGNKAQISELYSQADVALQESKATGKNRYLIYDRRDKK